MSEPTVSVIVPTYNDQSYIKECIDSVLAQTVSSLEVIIVDGGSTDGTIDSCQSYTDDRISILENGDLVSSLNKGIRYSSGKYIARVDADCICEDIRFEKQLNVFKKDRTVGIVGSQIKLVDPETRKSEIVDVPEKHEAIREQIPSSNPMLHPTWMVHKELFEQVGLYRDYLWEDYELLTRAIQKYKLINLQQPLVTEYDRRNSIMDSTPRYKSVSASFKCGILALFRGNYSMITVFKQFYSLSLNCISKSLRYISDEIK